MADARLPLERDERLGDRAHDPAAAYLSAGEHAPAAPARERDAAPRSTSAGLRDALQPLASLKATVVLMAMSVFLVFAGTLAQVDKGIWTVVDEYFRCAFAWIDLQLFFPRSVEVPGGFWFPGGWLIGALLLVNILAAHLLRFKVAARGPRLALGLLFLAAGAVLTGLIIGGAFDQEIAATENAAFWRVLLRLMKGGGAALVLMVGCMLVFKRRAGIVLLHGGIILLLIAEFITGATAVEANMRIPEGGSMNYVEHMRSFELVFIDRGDPDVDRVIAVPHDRLAPGAVVRDPALPVEIEVLQYMENSQLFEAAGAPANPATAGAGQRAVALSQPPISGTDQDQRVDVPSAYVTLRQPGGATLGTFLVSPWLARTTLERQTIAIDGTSYDVALRFARTYKPYRIELLDFRHDTYVGTETPKDFSSLVRLVDDERGIDRTVRIWMNNPLRYDGETFYQSSYEPGREVTILQVVRNRGWMIPYLSCMIVGVGMTLHMGANLVAFLRRRVAR